MTAGTEKPAEVQWRRLHPISPAVRSWKTLVAIVAIIAVRNDFDFMSYGGFTVQRVLWIIGAIFAFVACASVYFALAWRVTRYAVDDSAVFLHQGMLFRKQRHARLDRIQAINVVQPIMARFFGLSELKIEVAGGTDSSISLAYLREAEAQVVRNEILARASGIRYDVAPNPLYGMEAQTNSAVDAASGPQTPPGAPQAPESHVYEVSPTRLLWSIMRSGSVPLFVFIIVIISASAIISGEIASLLTTAPMALGVGGYLWVKFNTGFNFSAALSPDGIRMRHGLLEKRSQTVPPGRVQAVSITQPLLWRSRDWWRVEINVAGYGMENQALESVLLPVGTRAEAILALWMVLPDLGTDTPYDLLDHALSGKGSAGNFICAPRQAAWLDPISWRRNGFTTTRRALFLRRGRFTRVLEVVPHERTQSLKLNQGPVQRRLGLASFVVDSTPGPVRPRVAHLRHQDAAKLMDCQAVRAAQAREASGPEKWLQAIRENPQPHGPSGEYRDRSVDCPDASFAAGSVPGRTTTPSTLHNIAVMPEETGTR